MIEQSDSISLAHATIAILGQPPDDTVLRCHRFLWRARARSHKRAAAFVVDHLDSSRRLTIARSERLTTLKITAASI